MVQITSNLNPATEAEIVKSIHRYFEGCSQAYRNDDRSILHTVCAPDLVGFGTGPHEKAQRRDGFEDTLFGPKNFPFQDIIFKLKWAHIERIGGMAYASCEVDGDVQMDNKWSSMPPLRGSFVFRYEEPSGAEVLPWQMIHLHYSFPDTQTEDENIDMRALAEYNRELERKVEEKTRELMIEREKSERLLLNILPGPIAERLKNGERPIANRVKEVTILFADIVNFTPLSNLLSPDEVVDLLDRIFSAFDRIIDNYKLEKIKTIGDAYMAVAGIPEQHLNQIESVALAALEMQEAIKTINKHHSLSLRIGINTGTAVAGVIGEKKFIYDLWGDAVNTASRMESQGVPGKIQCTQAVKEFLQDKYKFETRGEIEVKGKGLMVTHFLIGEKEGEADVVEIPGMTAN
ncbi:MAG: adenylate/guanylate cyclase domain-containing protein [Bacteroidia bacterium]